MFVSSNKYSIVKKYFFDELMSLYSLNEIKLFWKELIKLRFSLNNTTYILEKEKLLFSESDLIFFYKSIKRIKNKEPLQYIIGKVFFCDLEIIVDKRALIPRPETEELVMWIKDFYFENNLPLNILDLGTGTGCIALSLKKIFNNSIIYALDKSEDALSLAFLNSKNLNLSIKLLKVDIFDENYPLIENSYDIWISNPPYIPINEKVIMENNVLLFEPHNALFTPNELPLLFYEQIVKKSKKYLKEKGMLFFEIHENYAQEVKNLMERENFTEINIKRDLQGKNRMICGINKF